MCETISVVLQHRYVNLSTETHEKYATPLMWLMVGVDESDRLFD
jgi:hypothetical protein